MTKQEREERKLQRMKELKQIEDELHASGIKNMPLRIWRFLVAIMNANV